MSTSAARGNDPERIQLHAALADAFLPAVRRLESSFQTLIRQVGGEAPSSYGDDLAKLSGSVERMSEKARWIVGLVESESPDGTLSAANIRHDLRMPMSGILGYAELLLEEMEEDRDQRFVGAVRSLIAEANVVLKEISTLLLAIDEAGLGSPESTAPATAEPQAAAADQKAFVAAASTGSGAGPNTVVGRILVVDDNASIRDLVTRRLQKQGHVVTPCSGGEEGVTFARTGGFDLIMLDLMMPGLSGVEVLNLLKRHPTSAAIPVIVMSALDEIDAAVRCIEAGADDYLSKPLNATLLTARIDTLLERKFLRDREQATLVRLKEEQQRADNLLHNIFPASVVKRLGQGEEIIADHFADVAVLFCDLVGFTQLGSTLSPIQTLQMLNGIFSGFDALAERNGVEKIKTVGDAYLLVAGIPDPVSDPAWRAVTMAREMGGVLQSVEHAEGLQLRIGISKGPAAAGVVGTRKLFYDVWGHTVNLASRLESLCTPGRILVSSTVQSALADRMGFERNDPIEVHGLGAIDAYYLR